MDNLINDPTNNSKKNSITQGIGFLIQNKPAYVAPQPYNNNNSWISVSSSSYNNNNNNKNKNYSLIEGFDGMIGPTQANNKNMKEREELTKQEDELNRSLGSYASSYKLLMDKAQNFLQGNRTYGKSIYTAQVENPDLINPNWAGCYKKGSDDGLIEQGDMGTMANIDTCKIRASDLGQSVFSLYKSDDASNNIKCAVGDDINKAKSLGLAIAPTVSYSFSKANAANTAELLYNGQIGTYTDSVTNNLVTDLKPFTDCDLLLGKRINTNNTVATYGYNCNGGEKSKFNPPPTPPSATTPIIVPDGYIKHNDKYYADKGGFQMTSGSSLNDLAQVCNKNDDCIGFNSNDLLVSSVGLLNDAQGSSSQIEGFETGDKSTIFYLKENSTVNMPNVNIDTSKTYRLVNIYDNIENGCLYSNADGRFNMYTCIDFDDQYWNLVALPQPNTFKFVNVNSKKSLYNANNIVNVLPTKDNDDSQSWRLIPVKGQPDIYQLKSVATNNCLYTGYDINTDTCTRKNSFTNNQFWKFIPITEGPKKCDQYKDTDKNLPDDCIQQIWKQSGCTNSLQNLPSKEGEQWDTQTPNYPNQTFWKNNTKETVIADMKKWAALPAGKLACYAPVPISVAGATINASTLWSNPWTKIDDNSNNINSLCQIKDGTILGSDTSGNLLAKKDAKQGIWSSWSVIKKGDDVRDIIQLTSGQYLKVSKSSNSLYIMNDNVWNSISYKKTSKNVDTFLPNTSEYTITFKKGSLGRNQSLFSKYINDQEGAGVLLIIDGIGNINGWTNPDGSQLPVDKLFKINPDTQDFYPESLEIARKKDLDLASIPEASSNFLWQIMFNQYGINLEIFRQIKSIIGVKDIKRESLGNYKYKYTIELFSNSVIGSPSLSYLISLRDANFSDFGYLKTNVVSVDTYVNDTTNINCCVTSITQLHNGNILGVNASDNELYQKNNLLDAWTKIKCPNTCCVTYISTMNDGMIVGIGKDGFVYTKLINKEWMLVDNSKKMTAVIQLQDGTIMGVDPTGNTFYKRNPAIDAVNEERTRRNAYYYSDSDGSWQ